MTGGNRPTALVLGGAGFIGIHLVPALAAMYDRVDVLDLESPLAAPPGNCIVGDLLDLLPDLARYDAVFHLAARVGGREALENDPLTVAGNLALDVAFFAYVVRTRPERAVYISSSAVYPAPLDADARHVATELLEESTVAADASIVGQPDGMYGWVKLTGERLAHVTTERHGVPVVCYRPFTVYGPGQTIDYPVPAICARAIDREDPIDVWGSGLQQRDFVHVDDVVAAIAVSHLDAPAHEPLNVCTGVATTFGDIATFAARAVGYRPALRTDRSKPGGARFRVGSPQRLARWYRSRIAVEVGIERLITGER